jgi:hypothetical protein
MNCKVKKIISPNVLEVEPAWNWSDCCGNIIKLDINYESSSKKWEKMLKNREIELRYPVILDCGSLQCEIYIEGQNIKDFL